MAAFPEFPWSDISKLNQRLSILEANMHSDREDAQARAAKTFKKIKETLEQNIKSIDVVTLKRAEEVCGSYLTINPTDKNIKSVLYKILPFFKETKLEFIQNAINKDPHRRKKVVLKKITKWEKLSRESLRDDMRSFIMDACRGEAGMPPCSLEDLFLNIKNLSSEGSEILNFLNDPTLFSSYEWKIGACSKAPPNIMDCISAKLRSKNCAMQVPDEEVDRQIKKMYNERTFRLRNLKIVYRKISNDSSQAVAGKYFEKVSVWYVGSFLPKKQDPQPRPYAFEKDMQKIGVAHDIISITDSRDPSLAEQDKMLTLDDQQNAPFPQDFIDFSMNEIRVPVMPMKWGAKKIDDKFFNDFFQEERGKRNAKWKQHLQYNEQKIENPRAIGMQTIGWPWLNDLGRKSVKLALGLNAIPVMNLTYNEGGNSLIGLKKDGSKFVIIGLDSYAFSKYLMEQELGRKLSEKEVTMAFAIDYGVKKEQIFFVEQPGDFHLDMSLAVIGEKTIAVNDAVISEEKFIQGLQEPPKSEKANELRKIRAAGKKIFEDITAENLEKHGFEVIRVAGRFHYPDCPPELKPYMNFFNILAITAPDGKKVVVALGIDEKYKEEFKKMIQPSGGEGIDFHFLNEEESAFCLKLHGGISCRSKIIPTPEFEE